MLIGLISDTHGLLRQEVIKNIKDCDLVIHAGDIGKLQVLEDIKKIVNVKAVRGNVDKGLEYEYIPYSKKIKVNGKIIYITHNIKDIDIDLNKENIDIVVYGHSHKKSISEKDGILYINPGSVGPRRFKLPTTMSKLKITDNIDEVCELYISKNINKFKNYIIEFIDIN